MFGWYVFFGSSQSYLLTVGVWKPREKHLKDQEKYATETTNITLKPRPKHHKTNPSNLAESCGRENAAWNLVKKNPSPWKFNSSPRNLPSQTIIFQGFQLAAKFPAVKVPLGSSGQWWFSWPLMKQLGGGTSNIFYFSPRKLGKIRSQFDLRIVFQMGWWFNHQLDFRPSPQGGVLYLGSKCCCGALERSRDQLFEHRKARCWYMIHEDCAVLGESSWIGLDWIGLDWIGLDWMDDATVSLWEC